MDYGAWRHFLGLEIDFLACCGFEYSLLLILISVYWRLILWSEVSQPSVCLGPVIKTRNLQYFRCFPTWIQFHACIIFLTFDSAFWIIAQEFHNAKQIRYWYLIVLISTRKSYVECSQFRQSHGGLGGKCALRLFTVLPDDLNSFKHGAYCKSKLF